MSSADVRAGDLPGETGETGEEREDGEERDEEGVQRVQRVGGSEGSWDDGLIARRASAGARVGEQTGRRNGAPCSPDRAPSRPEGSGQEAVPKALDERDENDGRSGHGQQERVERTEGMARSARSERVQRDEYGERENDVLRRRLGALRELIGLSRTRLTAQELAEAGRVLEEAGARGRLPRSYTTVAIAGASGSGKSSLFNALAGAHLSDVGMCRPTTAAPVSCTWGATGTVEGEGGADGLLDRLGIAPHVRLRLRQDTRPDAVGEERGEERREHRLDGLVLIDLPDHDSVANGHREQVDRLLRLVDAVVWVVDPEKYADALLHERYLRPLAGYAEVTFVVLNQTDRLPGEGKDTVLDDLRRLLDEDGMALGEHGEPGARVLATSVVTGEGVRELGEELGAFVASRRGAALRLSADLDGVVERLRPVYADPVPHALAQGPAGLTEGAREEFEDRLAAAVGAVAAGQAAERAWSRHAERACGTPWGRLSRWYERRYETRRTCGVQGAAGAAGPETGAGMAAQPTGSLPGRRADRGGPGGTVAGTEAGRTRAARPVVAQAVRELSERAAAGLPDAWGRTVRDAAWRGADGLPEALDGAMTTPAVQTTPVTPNAPAVSAAPHPRAAGPVAGGLRPAGHPAGRRWGPEETAGTAGVRMRRPSWWTAAAVGQGLLLALHAVGAVWLLAVASGLSGAAVWLPALLLLAGAAGGPALAWGCRAAARGPARAYGLEEERRLRLLAAGCGRSRVLEPVAAELLRYREVREQYVIAAGDARGLYNGSHDEADRCCGPCSSGESHG